MTTDRPLKASSDTRFASTSTSQDAALRGASLAFGKPPVKPKPKINTYSGSNGALAAATKVGGGRQHEKRSSMSEREGSELRWGYQNTGGSVGSSVPLGRSTSAASRSRMSRLDSTGFLQPPGVTEHAMSPSFIAATLAASRSASISPNPTGQQMSAAEVMRQPSFVRSPSSRRSSSTDSSDHVLDTTSIPPTNSLIGIFEQNAKSSVKERQPLRRVTKVSARPQTPMKHQTILQRTRNPSPSPLPHSAQSPSNPEPKPRLRVHSTSPVSRPLRPEIKAPKPIPAHTTGDPQKVAHPVPIPASRKPLIIGSNPIAIPNARKQNQIPENVPRSPSSDESIVSVSDYKPSPSFRAALNQNKHLTSTSTVSVNSSHTIDSMANAIVASSLASSRAASPSKQLLLQPPPPPPSRRSPRSHSHLFHNTKEASRTPSPSKQSTLRTTMRKPKAEAEIDEGDKRRSKKHIMKKHPNKHHEGDRKRWRDEITERERKRYEAVWASNRGLHIPPSYPGSEFFVSNLVARDIFSRSRLHDDVLEEVYGLVDRGRNGLLEKEEFVVGMWLIDQRLKGRKLPLRVSDHVWRSVGALNGIKVRKAGK